MAETELESKPKRRRAARPREEQPDTPDPIEIAMAAVATGADRHGVARAVLEKHARLIDVQCQREKEELAVLKVQRLTRWLILLAICGLIAALAGAVWVAGRSKSLVIEPFEVPPALAQRGLNGRVVSARVLDQLAALQRNTESMRGEKSYADNWQDDIKLAIPDTGVSLGEAWRTLKAWFGQETRIGGEIVQTPAGFAISTRAGTLSGGTISGGDGDIDWLIGEAALSIYKVTQPYRYASALPDDRDSERVQIYGRLTGDRSPTERKWAYNGLAVYHRMGGRLDRSLAMARRALAIDPQLLPALGNLVHGEYRLGHGARALEAVAGFESAFAHASNGEYDERISRANLLATQEIRARMLRDAPGLERLAGEMESLGATTSFAADAGLARADAAALRHDHRRSARMIGQLAASPDMRQIPGLRLTLALAELERASDLRDAAALPAILARLDAASVREPGGEDPDSFRLLSLSTRAIALARSGQAGPAAAIAAGLPDDCYDCLRAKGWAALAGGESGRAAAWFRQAIAEAAKLPAAHLDLGEALLAAGDPAGALVEAQAAASRAADWADPLKLSGDALVALRRIPEAEAAYRGAAAKAPRWGGLQLRWADVLWRLGRRDEARRNLAAAGAMDLGPAERRQLAQMAAKAAARR